MTDWQKIKAESPLAYTKACQWQSNLGVDMSMRDRQSQEWRHGNRWLYDFFDKQGILAWVVPHVGTETWWMGQLWNIDNGLAENVSSSQDRNQSEQELFTRAFQLLEAKLTQPAND